MAERTCIGCRLTGDQRSFLRVSRLAGGRVGLLDGQAQPMGRSAYVCPDSACIAKALHKGRLARALKLDVEGEDLERLKEELVCKLR